MTTFLNTTIAFSQTNGQIARTIVAEIDETGVSYVTYEFEQMMLKGSYGHELMVKKAERLLPFSVED